MERPGAQSTGRPKPRDLIDDLATFSARLPSWVNDQGLPLSYRHFRYGMAWIGRDEVRQVLRDASAARLAQATKDDYTAERRRLKWEVGD